MMMIINNSVCIDYCVIIIKLEERREIEEEILFQTRTTTVHCWCMWGVCLLGGGHDERISVKPVQKL